MTNKSQERNWILLISNVEIQFIRFVAESDMLLESLMHHYQAL